MTAPSNLDVENAQQPRCPSFSIANAALVVVFAFASRALDHADRIELWLALVVIAVVGLFAPLVHLSAQLVHWKLNSLSPELIQILVLYAISFFLPASYNQSSFGRIIDPDWDGSTVEYFRVVESLSQNGFFVFFGSFLSLACLNPVWFANPIWCVGVALLWLQQWKFAAVAGLLSTSLALCALFLLDSRWLFVIAPGTQTFKVRIGYYVWFGSMFLLMVSAFLRYVSWYRTVKFAVR